MLTVSVVIPSLNTAQTLSGTLESLKRNTIQPLEVFVVDGMSSDGTEEVARSFDCQLLPNPAVHTAAAAQIGIDAAKGDLIAFTDSDCLLDDSWLEKILKHFEQDPELDGVGGPVRLDKPLSRVQAYLAKKAVEGIPEKAEIISKKGMRGRFSGANCAYRRQLLLDINGIDLRFKTHASDIDLFWRALDNHARLLFDPEISVEHLGFAQDYNGMIRKSFGYGLGSARLAKAHFPGKRVNLRFHWRAFANSFRELGKPAHSRYPLCVFLDQSAFALGRTSGLMNKKDFC